MAPERNPKDDHESVVCRSASLCAVLRNGISGIVSSVAIAEIITNHSKFKSSNEHLGGVCLSAGSRLCGFRVSWGSCGLNIPDFRDFPDPRNVIIVLLY